MIYYTIDQAAQRVFRAPDTIRQWIRDGDLTARRNPLDGHRYVTEPELLRIEQEKRAKQRDTRRAA